MAKRKTKSPEIYLSAAGVAQVLGLSREYVAKACRSGLIPPSAWTNISGTYSINAVLAAEALGRELPPSLRGEAPLEQYKELHPQAQAAKDGDTGGSDMSTAVVKNKHARIRLQMDALALQQQQGMLVSKEQVYKDLFEFGSTMRARMQSIPASIVDDVMAATTRLACFRIIEDAITIALDELTRVDDMSFGKRPRQ